MAADIVLYVITAGLAGVAALLWRVCHKLTSIEHQMEGNKEDHDLIFDLRKKDSSKLEDLAQRTSRIEGQLSLLVKNGKRDNG